MTVKFDNSNKKLVRLPELIRIRKRLRRLNRSVVFTNGVFDILHRGHVEYLHEAKKMGDELIVGLNSDFSAGKVKGEGRPFVPQEDRAVLLAALEAVSYVCIFEEETPARLIEEILPDILVKGGDYSPHQIVGKNIVEVNGGKVVTIPLTPNRSTTNIIERIIEYIRKGNR